MIVFPALFHNILALDLVSQMYSLGGNSLRGKLNDLCLLLYVCFMKLRNIEKKCIALYDWTLFRDILEITV